MVLRESLTLRQKTCEALREAIADNRLPPGTRLVERDLCALLGVSRTSVREALRHLESERLIRMVPHKGPVVATLTIEEVREIYEIRALLEGLACEKFAMNASAEEVDQLRRTFIRMKRATADGDHQEVLTEKSGFYRVIFSGSKSDICEHMVNSLTLRIAILRRMSLASPGRGLAMVQEIEDIVKAAEARDPEAMKTACIAHVKNACSAVIPQFAGTQGSADSNS